MKTIKKDGYKITFIKDNSCFVVKSSNATRNKVFRTKDKVEATEVYSKFKSDIITASETTKYLSYITKL